VLVIGFSDVTVAELLKLKTMEALVASGDFELADPLLDDAENKEWSEDSRDYLKSIRLLRELQKNDTSLFRGDRL